VFNIGNLNYVFLTADSLHDRNERLFETSRVFFAQFVFNEQNTMRPRRETVDRGNLFHLVEGAIAFASGVGV